MTNYIAIIGLATGVSILAADACPELDGANLQTQLEYLQRERQTLMPACVSRAMSDLSLRASQKTFDRHAEAIKTLAEYLDYRMPDERSKYLRAASSNRDPYPASSALFNIGKAAVPYLIESIASASTSDTSKRNAVQTLSAIYREDPPEAVRVLRRASRSSEDWGSSQRLLEAARRASVCSGALEIACRDALYEPDSR